jgi:hypothetical protein
MNPKYKVLAPMGNLVAESLKVSSNFMRSGCPPTFPANLIKEATTAKDLAFSTTSLTYCLSKLYVTIPQKCKTETARSTEAAALKVALEAKDFVIPPALLAKIIKLIGTPQAKPSAPKLAKTPA